MDFILNFFYPKVCGFCNKITSKEICQKCEIKLNDLLQNQVIDYSNNRNTYFDYHIFLFKYEGTIREKIISYKFLEQSYLYKSFAKIITKNEKICGILEKYDIIVPVPIHAKRKIQRGYNQSELIAKEIKRALPKLLMCNNTLIKVNDNPKQSNLTKQMRKENVRNVYEIKNIQTIIDKRIILFDDVYTTGNTVNECSRILKKAGAKEILVITIAKD